MTDITQEEYAEIFGVELPEESPEETVPEGSEATPPEAGSAEQTDGEEQDADDTPAADEQKPEDVNAKNAERRRRREAQQKAEIERQVAAALQTEREKNDAEWAEMLKWQGLQDEDGTIVDTREKFAAYRKRQELSRMSAELKRGQLSPESLQRLTDDAVRDALAARDADAAKAEQARLAAEKRQQFEQQVAREIGEIHAIDPRINTIADILQSDDADRFRRLVDAGESFKSAYEIIHRDEIRQREVEAALRQQTTRGGKEHLTSTRGRGEPGSEVPEDVLALFRELIPGLTEDEYRKAYASFK